MEENKIKQLLLELLEEKPGLRRKQLIERCIGRMGFGTEQLRDRRVDSPVVQEKSRIGALLTALLDNGDVEENEAGRLFAKNSADVLLKQEQAEIWLLDLLKDGSARTKSRIYQEAESRFAGSNTRSLVGQAIAKLLREKRIRESAQGYVLPPVSAYPNTELGNWLLEARNGGDLQKCFLEAVHVKGGEWLESYAVRLMAEYYHQCGKTVTAAYVTGGSDDGGLDGVLETTDWLGFRERTLMQMKNRYVQVTPKDVREFYGAVCAEQGSRGVFVCTSNFHPEAQKLLDKVDNLIGIDGAKLFEIAKLCRFGIRDEGSRTILDDDLFLGV